MGTTVATLTLNEGGVNTASGTFTIALSASASRIRDLAGNQSSFGTQVISGNNVVSVLITNNGSADVLTISGVGSNCGGSTNFKFGSVNLATNYVNANTTFSGTSSNRGKLTWDPGAKTLTITLGAGTGSQSGVAVSTPIYTPSTALKDLASPGNTMAATPFSAPATSRF